MSIQALPDELIGEVCEYFTHPVPRTDLGEFPAPPEFISDRRTLRSLSLVSRTFLAPAQSRLFRHALISPVNHCVPGGAVQQLQLLAHALLRNKDRSAVLRGYMASLHVCWSANHPSHHLVFQLIAACDHLSYLSLDFEHRGPPSTGSSPHGAAAGPPVERLPVEKMLLLLESKPSIHSLNMRFTEVDVHLEHLYIPACLRFRLPELRSLRLKGVPTAHLNHNFLSPLPKLLFLHLEYFDLPPVQLAAYIDMVTTCSSLKVLSLVDLEDPTDILHSLPDRLFTSLEALIVDLDSTSLGLAPLARFTRLSSLNMGYSAFSPTELGRLPPSLESLAFFPGTLDLLEAFGTFLASPLFLPKLKKITIWGIQDAFWDNGDTKISDWVRANEAVAQCSALIEKKGIRVFPPSWQRQFEKRRQSWAAQIGLPTSRTLEPHPS